MASPYVTGPAHVYLGIGNGRSAVYLGTTEKTPKIIIRPEWEPFFNDIGGKIPFDISYQGEEGFIIGDFNRYNEPVYAALASRPRVSGSRGLNLTGDIGTMMITEGWAYETWVQFPYAAKAVYSAAGMPPCYHFYATYLRGPDELEPLGTTPRKTRLLWHALRAYSIGSSVNTSQFNPLTVASILGGASLSPSDSFALYDHDDTKIRAVTIN